MPVCRRGIPCSEPARGVRLVFTRADGFSKSAIAARDGSYDMWLPNGTYTVSVSPQAPIGRGIDPSTVRVTSPGRPRTVDFQIDTGIR